MTPEEAVAERLLALNAVTSLVGDRVYMLKAPQGEIRPLIVVQEATDVRRGHHFRGGTRRGSARVQVDVHVAETSGGDPYTQAMGIVRAMNGNHDGAALSGWKGASLGSPAFDVDEVRLEQRLAPIYEGDELRSVRIIQEYRVFYME